jgi:hypothetical protein
MPSKRSSHATNHTNFEARLSPTLCRKLQQRPLPPTSWLVEIGVDDVAPVLRVELCGETRRADEIAKHDGDRAALRRCLKVLGWSRLRRGSGTCAGYCGDRVEFRVPTNPLRIVLQNIGERGVPPRRRRKPPPNPGFLRLKRRVVRSQPVGGRTARPGGPSEPGQPCQTSPSRSTERATKTRSARSPKPGRFMSGPSKLELCEKA